MVHLHKAFNELPRILQKAFEWQDDHLHKLMIYGASYAGKLLFVITTDGMENASREYGYEQIKAMIEHQKVTYGWEFIFLGANIDAVSTAAKFGIQEEFAVKYHADSEGTQMNFEVLNEVVTSVREGSH